ncbi:hypothetical protein D2T32_11325 [Sinirhodobacter populi]|nr:hypothetical protein D2T32_11325 [Sinirhodobacter populi]
MDAMAAVQAPLIWSTNIEGYALTIGSGAIPTIFDSASIGTRAILDALDRAPGPEAATAG